MDETRTNFQNHGASIRNLEVQVAQIAKKLTERSFNIFLSDTILNPREECKTISLRSGRVIRKKNKDQTGVPKEAHMEKEKQKKRGYCSCTNN
ncbi:hypothetical protein AHAS_Ahas20G0249300 [Arachis hypogaea]